VHRLLESDGAVAADEGALTALALRLAGGDARLGSDPHALARAAAGFVARLATDPRLAALLTLPRRWHEVPLAMREPAVLWRGALDALVEESDGRLRVLEFKTGRPLAAHAEQLRLYVAAIQALLPSASLEGELAYLAGSQED
jgi:hypothetical protein